MAGVSFDKSSLGVNTDRIASSSRAFSKKNVTETAAEPQKNPLVTYTRDTPDTSNAPFVDVDGRRFYLNMPRGTYLNILV